MVVRHSAIPHAGKLRPATPLPATPLLVALLLAALLLAGCDGPQSTLDPAGGGARRIAGLFLVMAVGAGVLWVAVIGLAVYAAVIHPHPHPERYANRLILWGGAVGPTLILAALLTYGLGLMPALRAPGADLRIAVTGEQFWWRVAYRQPDDDAVVASANELRLPAGARVELVLDSLEVIHSLWIPSIAGKMDMIPGRTTRLILEPERPGVYRGVCAEYCGTSHTLMAFAVEVMEPAGFAAWLEREAGPATDSGAAGQERFLANGCGACHTVRGTDATGTVGPDLTHIGSRRTIAAGIMDNTQANRVRFIAAPVAVKPGVEMPAYGMLPAAEIAAIAAWLGRLQ
ncbi:MAG TPA: c-type cytochrome [Thalassobaculum sp.]